MNARIVVVVIAMFSSGNSAFAADWVEMARNDKSVAYMDRASIVESPSGVDVTAKFVFLSPVESNHRPGIKVKVVQGTYKVNCSDKKIALMRMIEFADLETTKRVSTVGPFPFDVPADSMDRLVLRRVCELVKASAPNQKTTALSDDDATLICSLSNASGSKTGERTFNISYRTSTVNEGKIVWPAVISDDSINWSDGAGKAPAAFAISRYSGRITIGNESGGEAILTGHCDRGTKKLF